MTRLTDLKFLFRLVAVVELVYAGIGMIPPRLVGPATGWVLSPDGHWVAKILAVSLATQAWVAWTLRDRPDRGVALGLAFYQFASATVDWVMALALADDGIFATRQAQIGVMIASPTHYLIGALLLIAALRKEDRT